MIAMRVISTVSYGRAARSVIAIALSFGACLPLRVAQAGESSPVADRLFSEGLELARRGDCARARANFAASYAADPAPGTLVNWALCEEELGRIGTAFGLLLVADQRLPAGHPRLSDVKKELLALGERVPYLRIHPLGPLPPGTAVLKDAAQVQMAALDQRQPTDPGHHVIEIHAPGHEVRRYEVNLAEGRTFDLAVEPGAPSTRAPASSSTDSNQRSGDLRTFGWIVGATGIAALGVGTVTGFMAWSRWNDVQRGCDVDAKTCYTDQGYEATASGRSLATVSTVAFAAGAVGLLGGGYMILSARPRSSSASGPSVIAVTANAQGVQLSGAF